MKCAQYTGCMRQAWNDAYFNMSIIDNCAPQQEYGRQIDTSTKAWHTSIRTRKMSGHFSKDIFDKSLFQQEHEK